jgi:hypothetical protein
MLSLLAVRCYVSFVWVSVFFVEATRRQINGTMTCKRFIHIHINLFIFLFIAGATVATFKNLLLVNDFFRIKVSKHYRYENIQK